MRWEAGPLALARTSSFWRVDGPRESRSGGGDGAWPTADFVLPAAAWAESETTNPKGSRSRDGVLGIADDRPVGRQAQRNPPLEDWNQALIGGLCGEAESDLPV